MSETEKAEVQAVETGFENGREVVIAERAAGGGSGCTKPAAGRAQRRQKNNRN
ncbi:MAG: hypothetical protein ACOX1J_04700 [Dethiobacteria bacterium]